MGPLAKKLSLLGLLVVTFGVLIACGSGGNGDQMYVEQEGAAEPDGKALHTKKCNVCHGADGKRGISGATDLSTSVLTKEQRIEVITKGRKTMVGWEGVLTVKEIDAIADHLETLRGK